MEVIGDVGRECVPSEREDDGAETEVEKPLAPSAAQLRGAGGDGGGRSVRGA